MIGGPELDARVRRLEELARGLAKEMTLWRGGEGPLLYLERRSYLDALRDAVAGTEAAAAVLTRASKRLRDEAARQARPPHEPEVPPDGLSESA